MQQCKNLKTFNILAIKLICCSKYGKKSVVFTKSHSSIFGPLRTSGKERKS